MTDGVFLDLAPLFLLEVIHVSWFDSIALN